MVSSIGGMKKPQDVVDEVMNRAKCGSVDNSDMEILPSFLLDEDKSYQQGYEQLKKEKKR